MKIIFVGIVLLLLSGCATYVGTISTEMSQVNFEVERAHKCFFKQGVVYKEKDGFSIIPTIDERMSYYGMRRDWLKKYLLSNFCNDVVFSPLQNFEKKQEFEPDNIREYLESTRSSNSEDAEINLFLIDRNDSQWSSIPRSIYFVGSILSLGIIPYYQKIPGEIWIYISLPQSKKFSLYQINGSVPVVMWTPLLFSSDSYSFENGREEASIRLHRGMLTSIFKKGK